jgi:hypothetical protein
VNDHLGDGVSVRRWSSAPLFGLGLVVLAPGAASAEPSDTTPGQSGVQGCREDGKIIAGATKGEDPFGRTVRENAPIADENALFFAACD